MGFLFSFFLPVRKSFFSMMVFLTPALLVLALFHFFRGGNSFGFQCVGKKHLASIGYSDRCSFLARASACLFIKIDEILFSFCCNGLEVRIL